MEILINELSLSGQFNSVEHFVMAGLKPFIKVINDIDYQYHSLYKKSDFFQSKVTQQYTIHDIIIGTTSRQYDEIRKFKSQLMMKLFDNPYWENNRKHFSNNVYLYNGKDIYDSSLAEASERDKIIVSFCHNDFQSEQLSVYKDNAEIKIDNLIKQGFFTQIPYDRCRCFISFENYCREKFKNSNLNFDNIDKKEGFSLIKTKEEEGILCEKFDTFSKLTWEEIRASKGLEYRKYDYDYEKKHFKNTNEKIDYFKLSGKDRCYGYRKDDVFFVLGFDFEHRKSEGK